MQEWRNKFKVERFVVLAEYFEQQTDCCRYVTEMSQFTFIFTFATEPSTVGSVILERYWKRTFDFTEIVTNYGLKWGTVS